MTFKFYLTPGRVITEYGEMMPIENGPHDLILKNRTYFTLYFNSGAQTQTIDSVHRQAQPNSRNVINGVVICLNV